MYKNVYVGEVNIIQLVYNAGVLSRLCCTLQKYFGPVHHNQLKDNVNGMGGEMGRGGAEGTNPVHFYFVQRSPMGPDDIHFCNQISRDGQSLKYNI